MNNGNEYTMKYVFFRPLFCCRIQKHHRQGFAFSSAALPSRSELKRVMERPLPPDAGNQQCCHQLRRTADDTQTHQPADLVVVQHDERLDVGLPPEERLQELARLLVAVDGVVAAAAPRPLLVRLAHGHGHLCKEGADVT